MTQEEIAQKIGKTQAFISSILRGKCRPSYQTAKDLCIVTGIPIEVWMESPPEEIRKALNER
jgi:transcriptional regulator with XRE-family HTH domain